MNSLCKPAMLKPLLSKRHTKAPKGLKSGHNNNAAKVEKHVGESPDNPSIQLKSACDITQVVSDATQQAFMRLARLLVDV